MDKWLHGSEGKTNLWCSQENALNNCLAGQITNLLHHIHANTEATEFKRLVTMDRDSLLQEMNVEPYPADI